ncbi:MAG: Omp28-related outer membrane protein [Ignavibacteria bacterium]|jgi:hypothetical protein
MKKIFIVLILLVLISNIYSSPRRVLVELGTSCDCIVCPNAHKIIVDSILPMYPQSVIISIHANEVIPHPNDPFTNFHGHEIRDLLCVNFPTPGFWIDRSTLIAVPWNYTFDTVKYRYNNYPISPLDIVVYSKNYNPTTRQFNISVRITAEQNLTGIYYLNLVITEDNLIYKQSGAGNNYVHNWVLRDMVNEARGDTLINGNWVQNQGIEKSFSTILDTGWVPSNCKYAFFVYKSNYPDTMLTNAIIQQATNGTVTGSIGINNIGTRVNKYSLSQNYPNPFNPVTNIKFSIPKTDNISLKVYDILGKEVEEIFSGNLSAGTYNAEFNAKNISSGIYFYVLKTNSFFEKKKMVVLK